MHLYTQIHIFFMHSLTVDHFDQFQILSLVTIAAHNMDGCEGE